MSPDAEAAYAELRRAAEAPRPAGVGYAMPAASLDVAASVFPELGVSVKRNTVFEGGLQGTPLGKLAGAKASFELADSPRYVQLADGTRIVPRQTNAG